MRRNKQVGKGGRSKSTMESEEQEWNFSKIRKEIENLGSSCLTWKERKDLENKKVVQLGGKASKQQRLPLSVARVAMSNQKQREEKMMQEKLALGRLGALLGDVNTIKRHVDKRKPIELGLKPSEGNFVNGCLHVDRLLKAASRNEVDNGRPMAKKGKKKGGKKNHKKKSGRGKRH